MGRQIGLAIGEPRRRRNSAHAGDLAKDIKSLSEWVKRSFGWRGVVADRRKTRPPSQENGPCRKTPMSARRFWLRAGPGLEPLLIKWAWIVTLRMECVFSVLLRGLECDGRSQMRPACRMDRARPSSIVPWWRATNRRGRREQGRTVPASRRSDHTEFVERCRCVLTHRDPR